jgi:hypothetical protein
MSLIHFNTAGRRRGRTKTTVFKASDNDAKSNGEGL